MHELHMQPGTAATRTMASEQAASPHAFIVTNGTGCLRALQVAAFAMGRGPLALPNCPWLEELPRFGAVLSFPVIPKAGRTCKSQPVCSCQWTKTVSESVVSSSGVVSFHGVHVQAWALHEADIGSGLMSMDEQLSVIVSHAQQARACCAWMCFCCSAAN
jgi:hypothetical protein